MDLSTILGMVLALIGLIGGMIFKGVSPVVLLSPASVFIILIGTTGAVFNAFPLNDAKNIPKLFGLVFTNKKGRPNTEVIAQLVEFAQMVRKEGLLSLEAKMNEVEDPFLKRGIGLLMDGQGHDFIEETLSEDIEAMEERHNGMAGVFSQAGTYAPTLGVLGAVIGLVAALGNMGDTEKLGHAISAAFIATLYGIFTGYVLWHPFSNKLKRKSKEEVVQKTIILQGILLLEQGISPNLVQEKLLSFLPQKERDKIAGESGKGEK